jgi:hypothetical protein
VFCGGSPLTAEHVWPQWIGKYLPKIKGQHFAVVESEGSERTEEFRGERVPFTTKIKCVCETCNTGWMHELETTAEPVLAPLILGKSQTWHEWRQAIAATWALKTSIMIEQGAQNDLRAIPTELYRPFRRWLRPPINYTQIWAARYVGNSPHFYGRSMMRFLLSTPEGVPVPNDLTAYGACLQVGALAFRLFGHIVQDGPVNVPEDDIARSLVPIWPVTPSIQWPPELAVNDDGMEVLVKSMGDVPPAEPIRAAP